MKSALEAIRARALERLQNAEDLTALEKAFSAKTAKDLKADFSEEYARSMRLVENE